MHILLRYLKPLWRILLLTLLFATISQVFSILGTIIWQKLIDDYGLKVGDFSFEQFMRGILFWLGISIGVAGVSRIAKAFEEYFVASVTEKLGAKIYKDGIKKSLSMPFSAFENQLSGETLGVIEKVKDDVKKLVQQFVSVIFSTLIGLIFVVGYSYRIHWAIGPIFLASVPILILISTEIGKRVKEVQKGIVKETGELAGATTETLRNIEIVKSLGLVDQENKRLETSTDGILGLELKKIRKIRSLTFWQGSTIQLIRMVLFGVLLVLVYQGKVTIGEMLLSQFFAFYVFEPLYGLGNTINTFREAEAGLEKFEKIMEQPDEVTVSKGKNIDAINSFELGDTSFQYQSADTPALKNINIKADHGESIAFVGPSGSGKSTLVKMLIGLYEPTDGVVRFNDIDRSKIDLSEVRKNLGIVSQETNLFSGTIRDNLQFVRPDATDEQMLAVVNQSSADNILSKQGASGLDTVIGENGIKLSGGERQRLSIARALLREPSLLIFDEATSALDSITEDEISKTIEKLADQKDRITVQIAHRLSTIMNSDKIYVLEEGSVVEQGTHEELIESKGLYYAMWRQQTGKNS